MKAVPCQTCEYWTENEQEGRTICGNCGLILKWKMAKILREEEKIYISESNHWRKQRAHHITKELLAKHQGESCREVAKKLGVSAQTISRLRRKWWLW